MATQESSVDLSTAELGAWRGLLRVHTALVKALDAELAAAHNLPLSSYEVLITLESAPGRKRRMAELADSVLLSRSGMTRLVDRLEKDELLVRDTCTDDGRGCYAVLTEKGAELLPVLVSLLQWGNRWTDDDGGPVELRHHGRCQQPVTAQLRCAAGHQVDLAHLDLAERRRPR